VFGKLDSSSCSVEGFDEEHGGQEKEGNDTLRVHHC
jgi:hypothetical protein